MKLHIPVYPGASFSLADVERALPGARLTYDASSKDKLGGGCHIEWEDGLPDPLASLMVPRGHEERLRFLRATRGAFEIQEGEDRSELPRSWLDRILDVENLPSAVEVLALEDRLEAARAEVRAREDAAEERLRAAGIRLGDSFIEFIKNLA